MFAVVSTIDRLGVLSKADGIHRPHYDGQPLASFPLQQ
jgi:hypothetical protein